MDDKATLSTIVIVVLLVSSSQCNPVALKRGGGNVCHGSSCYVVITDKLTWSEAKAECVDLGGELVAIDDDAENEVVHKLASELGDNVLIGGYEMKGGGTCAAFAGRTRMSYTHWATGQPEHVTRGENCIELRHGDGKWNVVQCSLAHASVCETPKKPTPPPVVAADWDCAAISCYSTIDEKVTWSEAQDRCVSRGGNLVQIDDKAENERVHDIAREFGDNVFIGAHDTQNEQSFHWAGSNDLLSYTNWAIFEPNNAGSGEDCVELYRSDGKWNDRECSAKRYAVCEKVRDPTDADSWECKEFSCYTTLPERMAWMEAQQECVSLGANLVQIDNEKENKRVHRFAKELGNHVYIGGNDRENDNQWYWVGSGMRISYTNWAAFEPNDAGTGEDCIELYHTDGRWNDRQCSLERHGVCERSNVKCDAEFEGSCYVLVQNEASWHVAEEHCKENGAHLVEITSRAENEVVHALSKKIDKDLHIGANDISHEGNFEWAKSESALTYTNWAHREPNNAWGNEDCVEMYRDGNWNDRSCNDKRASVCERPL